MIAALRRRLAEARRRRVVARMAGPRLLRAFAAAYPDAAFVEIGANDGERHDHLHPQIRAQRWHGVMVEPVPYVFERLRANYGDLARISLENVAIADADGRRALYHVEEVDDPVSLGLPGWYDALGSFSREEVIAHLAPGLERLVVERQVECLSLASLLERHSLDPDLVAIDTEGYDAEIVAQIDLRTIRPRLIVFEHYHLGPEERGRCLARLRAAGYGVLEEHFDTFCLDLRPADALSRAFARLRPALPAVTAAEERER